MKFYSFNIGDYRKDTGHLSPLEHGIYRVLLDSYYDHEGPLPADNAKLMRTHNIRTKEEKSGFQRVLEDFFYLDGNFYRNDGADKVITKILEKSDKARASAESRWGREHAKAMRTQCEGNANDMLPVTHNLLPVTHNPEPNKNNVASLVSDFENLWSSFDQSLGDKGSKKNALAQFKKLKPDQSLFAKMLSALSAQIENKKDLGRRGQFVAPFQHVERWLKNERWNDELVKVKSVDYSAFLAEE